MSKKHYFWITTEIDMPCNVRDGYRRFGLKGAICGYMRKTTTEKSEVTCQLCLRELKRIGATHD